MKRSGAFVGLLMAVVFGLGVLPASCSSGRAGSDADADLEQFLQRFGSSEAPAPTLRRQTMIENPTALRVGERFVLPGVSQLDDTVLSALEIAKSHRAIVFAMTSTGCPLSTMYAPRLAAMEAEYASRRTAFVHVNVVDAESREEMRQFVREHRLRGAYVPDKDHVLATALAPRTTTEVFLFDPTLTLIYRGAIDDQFGVGTAADAPRRQFLRDALDSYLAGEAPKVAATWAPGCLVDPRGAGTAPPATSPGDVTYMGRVSKIIDAHCVECHRPFGVAPFSLAAYQDIAGRARMIEAVVRDGLMPPGHGVRSPPGDTSPWVNPREVPADEQADLLAWLNSSRPIGEMRRAPLPLERPRGWVVGTPDVLLTAGPIELPLAGPMQYVRSIVPTNFTTDRWVSIFECRPMKQNAIHHALVWLLPPGSRVPALGENATGLELLLAYSPGQGVVRYNTGTARRIPAGSMLLVDMYARPMGRLMFESLRIGLKTLAQPPGREVRTLVLGTDALTIPPGSARAVNRAEMHLAEPSTVLAMTPYMRARGTRLVVLAQPPGGSAAALLDAERYDYRWQVRHEYAEPRRLAPGTTLTLIGVHDNSETNRNNPDARTEVPAGPRPGQEAMFVAIEVLRETGATSDPPAAEP